MALGPDTVPRLWRLARLDYDPARQRPVLLYPEGAVLLNDTGLAILQLVDGSRSVAECLVLRTLGHPARVVIGVGANDDSRPTTVTADVTAYLARLAERELIQ